MVNKRGFLRIVEATIAVLIIFVALIFISSNRSIPDNRDIGLEIPSLIDEIARNLTFREEVANGVNEEPLKSYVELSLRERLANPSLNLSVEICNITEEVCFLSPYPDTDSEIFSSERVISGSVKNKTVEPKKIKVFMWRNT